jgi:hypothetical protein
LVIPAKSVNPTDHQGVAFSEHVEQPPTFRAFAKACRDAGNAMIG